MTSNTFSSNRTDVYAEALFVEFETHVSATLTRNRFVNTKVRRYRAVPSWAAAGYSRTRALYLMMRRQRRAA